MCLWMVSAMRSVIVLSKNIIPGKSVFTIRSESTKKDQLLGGGNFQDDAGMAVSIVNVTVMTVRVLMLIACVAGLFVLAGGRRGPAQRATDLRRLIVEVEVRT